MLAIMAIHYYAGIELTGSSVESSAYSVKWNISNRYYEAEVTLEVKGDLDKEKGAWQALITICNLNEVVRRCPNPICPENPFPDQILRSDEF